MKYLLKNFVFLFLVFFVILFLATHGLLNAYFEQDEWGGFADTINSYTLPWWSFFASKGTHFIPLGSILWKFLYEVFGYQAQFYYLIQLVIHSLNSVLVYTLALQLSTKKSIALLCSFLFLLNGRAQQAFTHLAIFNSTDMAMLFMLLFFIYLAHIKEKIITAKNSVILILIFFISICFREEGFIIIPLFVVYLLTFGKSKINKSNSKSFIYLIIGVFITFLIRIFAQSLNTAILPASQQITGSGAEYNLLTIPIKFIVQNLIYSERIVIFLINHAHQAYPGYTYFTSQAPLMDAAFFYIFGLIISVLALWLWLFKPKDIANYIIFFLAWIGSNAFMLSFVGRHISVLEPRYLYFASFPVFCFLAIFIHSVYVSRSKLRILDYIKKTSVIVVFALLIITSLQEIRLSVSDKVHGGIARKTLLKSLHEENPSLSRNTIFYIKCKKVCYRNGEFGIPNENVLPFSSGPGMIFLATYARGNEKEWGPFFADFFLWGLLDEGYKKIGDNSYGYFTNKNKLEETLRVNNLSKDVVVALEYDEEKFIFKNITKSFIGTIN